MIIGTVTNKSTHGKYFIHDLGGYYQLSRDWTVAPNGGYFNLDSLLGLYGFKISDVTFSKT